MKTPFLRAPSLLLWSAFVLPGAGVLPPPAAEEKPELVPQIEFGALQIAPREDDPNQGRVIQNGNSQTYRGVAQWRDPKNGGVLRTVPLAARPEIGDMASYPVSTALSAGGTILANVGRDKNLYWQDARTGAVLRKFPNQVYPLVFSPNDKFFVSQQINLQVKNNQRLLVLRSVPDGGVLQRLALPSRVDSIVWSSDATRLAAKSSEKGMMRLQVWDTTSGRSLWSFEQKAAIFYQMWFLPDNSFALLENKTAPNPSLAGDTHQVHLWKANGQFQTTLRHDYKSPHPDVRWSVLEDGRLLTSEVQRAPVAASKTAPVPVVPRLPFTNSDQTATEKRVTYLWDVPKAAAPRALKAQEESLALNADWLGQYYMPPQMESKLALPVALKRVRLANGRIMVADDSRLWQGATGKLVRAFAPIPPRSSTLDIAPDGKYFASAGGGGGGSSGGAFLGVWQSDNGKLLWHKAVSLSLSNGNWYSEAGDAWATTILFSKDGARILIASALDEPPLALYRTRDGKQIWTTKRGENDGIGYDAKSAAWSSDNKLIALTSSPLQDYFTTQVQIVNAANGRKGRSWKMSAPVGALAWSRDNRTLACATATGRMIRESGSTWFDAREKIIELRNARDGRVGSTLRGASADLIALQFSPNGLHLAGAASDGNIHIWSVQNGKLLHTLNGHFSAARDVTWSGNDTIVSVGEDGATRFWSARKGKLLATALILQSPATQPEKAFHDTRKKGFGGGEFMQLPKTEWLFYTPEGFYDASPGAEKWIRWRVGNQLFPEEKYKARFHQPARVLAALRAG